MKVRALIRKERNPETWKGDNWLDPDETDNLEPPSHSESSSPVEAACPPVSEETSLPLLENPVMLSLEVDVLGASLSKADLANTTAEWLIGQEQRPVHGPSMAPFPGGAVRKSITLDLFHHGGGKDLSSLEYIFWMWICLLYL